MKTISILCTATAISAVSAAGRLRSTISTTREQLEPAAAAADSKLLGGSSSTSGVLLLPQHFLQSTLSTSVLTVDLGGPVPSQAAPPSRPSLIASVASAEDVGNAADALNLTRAHDLAASGDLEGMQELLNKEPYLVNSRDTNGWTPLHEAARSGQIEMIALLLEYGADLNARTFSAGATPLYEAKKYNGKDSTVVRYLLSLGALWGEGKARLRGKAAELTSREDLLQQRVPHKLAAQGSMDELSLLADVRGDWVFDARDENGWTPLHEAARYGHVHVARFLIEDKGVSVNVLSKEGGTPFYYARLFQGDGSSIINYLESQGATIQYPSS